MAFDTDSYSIDINKEHALIRFSEAFACIFNKYYLIGSRKIVVLCIGTDRSTGDCLGPLVGHKLSFIKYRNIFIYGTLDEPVHAKNLCDVLEKLKLEYVNPFIIAVDACLGKAERIGCITIGKGPLKPGAGVNKNLPEVGDIHITGVVNISGFMEYLILQNTRLNIVMKMADTIANGIHYTLWKYIVKRDAQLNESLIEYSNNGL